MSTTAPSEHQRDVSSRPSAPKRSTNTVRAVLLVLASIVFSLLLCEIGLRLFTTYGARAAPSPRVAGKADKPLDAGDAMRYILKLPGALGTDRRWFLEDPPPLPNRAQVSPQRLERYKDFERRGIFTFQADYLWNRNYVESQRCAPNSFFESYPDTVLAFNPPTQSLHPRYRFPPNTTMGSGLVTNEFGLRGPPLTLAKPLKTIRIAFLGASTTVGFHYFPFSYPERVAFWLNRFAAANHFDVRFEALNGGREGLNSDDIAPIVRDELLPLDPDLAVYYEGSNQFSPTNLLSPRIPARKALLPRDLVVDHKVPEWIRTNLAMGDLLDRSLSGFGSLVEPPKPSYRLNWPAGVDERKPPVDSPDLPLQLPTIVKDLDSIRASLASIGGQLVLCSFEWLARDAMRLSPNRHQFIHQHLNTAVWPLRYADIRRLADFQNRVFRGYALDRRIPFVDVAGILPQDPDLFSDAIHLTDTGERVKAWIVFQQLLPILRRQIESGQLPRSGAAHPLPGPPSLAASDMPVRCGDSPTGPLERIPGALSLENIDLVLDQASLDYGHPVKVVTAAQQWTYAAEIPINAPAGLARPCYLFLRARVVDGQIGLGVMELGANTFQIEEALKPSGGMMDIYVPVLFPDRAVTLMIRNIAPGGVRSRILIEETALLAFLKPLPEETLKSIPLEEVRLEGHAATLSRSREGLRVTTAPGQGAYAGRAPLGLNNTASAGLRVHVWVRVLDGRLGVGILTAGHEAFLIERSAKPSPRIEELILPLPSPPVTGDLIIRNFAANNIVSKALIERIEIRKAP